MKSKFFSSVFVTPSHPQQGQLLVTASFISLTGHIFFFLGGGGGGGGDSGLFHHGPPHRLVTYYTC